jgi:hypothetical protein
MFTRRHPYRPHVLGLAHVAFRVTDLGKTGAISMVSSPPGSPTGLPDGDVETVPDVDVGDGENQRRQSLFVVMLCGSFPDLMGQPVRPVADASERFGERQCGTHSLIKAGVVPLSRYSENALICGSTAAMLKRSRTWLDG